MMRINTRIVLLAATLMLAATTSQAVPPLISYQGQLNDQAGLPVNATISFIFSIYDVEAGGTALWTEGQTLLVSNGLFNVQLGAVQGLPSALFMKDELYLGIKVGADPEMTPRQRITSSAYSQRAAPPPPEIPPALKILSWYGIVSDSLPEVVLGTVPQGFKWIIANIDLVHQNWSTACGTSVFLNNKHALPIWTIPSPTDLTIKRARLSWNRNLGPVLTAGQSVLLYMNGKDRTAGASVYYVEVPDTTPSNTVFILDAVVYSPVSQTIGTVPAGKKWKVVSMAYSAQHKTNTQYEYGIKLNDQYALYRVIANGTKNSFGCDFDSISFADDLAPTLTEGQTIKIELTTSFDMFVSVVVIEE